MKINFNNLTRFVIGCTLMLAVFLPIGAQLPNFTAVAPLPQLAPMPDMLLRDSFGTGPEGMRPASGKGTLRDTYLGQSFGGFWLEFPGIKTNRWATPDSGDTWRFCGTAMNPHEFQSPLQIAFGYEQNTILCTALNAQISSTIRPAMLMPLPSGLNVPYEIEIDGTYWDVPNAYLAVGFTNSGSLTNNLSSAGDLFMVLKSDGTGSYMRYEFRRGGFNGQLLASGLSDDFLFNQIKVRYDPRNRNVGASLNGQDLGTFASNISRLRYAAFEGNGYADNFVVRRLP
ncbi:MAG: hypothetical protein ABL959_16365 [Pyrinomonadaceae bacterium]